MFYSLNVLKRFGLFAVVSLLFVSTVLAQGGRRMSEEEAKEAFDANFAEMIVSLELSEEVAPKVKSVLWSQQEKMQELRASMQGGGGGGNSLARSGIREKMTTINSETMEALSELLSEDQMDKYSEIRSSRRGDRGRGQGQRRSNPPQ